MASVKVVVTGDKRIDAMLKKLEPKVRNALSRKATRKAAKDIVLPAAKERAPFNTGDLEESLTVSAMTRSRNSFGHRVGTKDGAYQGEQFYGGFMEFGTKERQHKSGKQVGRIDPAKNFAYLRPAVYDNAAKCRALYLNALNELIRGL